MPRCVSSFFCLILLLAGLLAQPAGAAQQVDVELVIATDVSRSITEAEALLQRHGIAAALRSPEVVRAIQNGALGRIAVVYVDWSNEGLNRVVVDWQLIQNMADAEAFAEALTFARMIIGNRTSISGALSMAVDLMETNSYDGRRRVIDISGDGPNNMGASLAPVREEVLAKGVIINGLPVLVDNAQFAGGGFSAEVDKYYAGCVIGGPGAFLIVARGLDDFATAIRHKLVLEISDGAAGIGGALITPAPATRESNCDRAGAGNLFGTPIIQ